MKRIITSNGTKYIRVQTAIWAGAIAIALCYGLTSGKVSTPRLDIQYLLDQAKAVWEGIYATVSAY